MFSQARELHTRLGNNRGLVHALDELGTVYGSEGKLEVEHAEELYTGSESICTLDTP